MPIIPNRTVTNWSHSKNFPVFENTEAYYGSTSRTLLLMDFLHITFCCVHIVKEWLDRHPLDGKFSRGMSFVILAALVHISGQTKIWYLHQVVIAHKDITSRKVPMDEFLLRQVFLEQNEQCEIFQSSSPSLSSLSWSWWSSSSLFLLSTVNNWTNVLPTGLTSRAILGRLFHRSKVYCKPLWYCQQNM